MKNPKDILNALCEQWEGTCRTWLTPDELSDASPVKGIFYPILGGGFVRHEYEATIQGQTRTGEDTLAFNPAKKKFESAWMDTFHMSGRYTSTFPTFLLKFWQSMAVISESCCGWFNNATRKPRNSTHG